MKRKALLAVFVLFLGILPAMAQEDPADSPAPDETAMVINDSEAGTGDVVQRGAGAVSAGDVFKMVLILIGVLAAIYGVFHLMKKAGGPGFSSDSTIRVLSTQGLGANRALHVIEVDRQVFLVGATEHNVSLVSELTDKETLDRLHLEAENRPSAAGRSFSGIFKGLFPGRRGAPKANIGDSMAYMKKQKDRLKDL